MRCLKAPCLQPAAASAVAAIAWSKLLCSAAEGLAAGLDFEAALQDPSMVKMDSSAQVTASCWLHASWPQ